MNKFITQKIGALAGFSDEILKILASFDANAKFNALMAQRRPIYQSVAKVQLDTTCRRPQDTGENILLALINNGTVDLPPGLVRQTAARYASASVITVTGQNDYEIGRASCRERV